MDAIQQIISKVESVIIGPLISLVSFLAVVIFIWGLFDFVRNSDDSAKRTDGVQHMIWGVVGLAIMFSVYGILNVIIGLWK